MYERASHPVIPLSAFVMRLLRQLALVCALIALSLFIGVMGYRIFENLSWIDSLLNASMLLGGMGEIGDLKTDGGKLFASFFALYSQLFMIGCGGLLLLPVLHRLLHHIHKDVKNN